MIVTLIDYGAGNLASVIRAFGATGASTRIAREPDDIAGAAALVIPGVGHFNATGALSQTWHIAIRNRIAAGGAVLGICLGLQWLFDGSDEAPGVPGLGIFPGRCFQLRGDVKVPHVGWNTLAHESGRLLDGVAPNSSVYFTHTFAAPVVAGTVATTTHGVEFSSVVERGRVMGAQFHPEKSGAAGLKVIGNFLSIAREGC